LAILNILAAGVIAGIVSNATGYMITGRLFHSYQAKTPNTWRLTETSVHYRYSAAVRIAACIGVALLYASVGTASTVLSTHPFLRSLSFGSILWAVTILPLVVEVALFVNWHRGFVVGLLLDWLVVCELASLSTAMAIGAA
jgi:hypothetical protein